MADVKDQVIKQLSDADEVTLRSVKEYIEERMEQVGAANSPAPEDNEGEEEDNDSTEDGREPMVTGHEGGK